ncbi:CRISPR-associated endonuclease Cas2 [Litorimonas sp.]|uniref:CRISPR-associated endonuclease Cas2 n=1 Tax=Litorimonas sp. TaxID=1892381 RepID=UPI003A8AF917
MRVLSHLSAYQHMWIMVLFDLPTTTKAERRAYTQFRDFLLDHSFVMSQYSVYLRHTTGRAQASPIIKRIEQAVPPEGKVDILQFTDRQYADIVSLRGQRRRDSRENPNQLLMF